MPTIRYEIRSEYGLADPELLRAADKDDPEAVLEGVAMSGLVGVLRQLGDLAEFATEIFHELHEEVMSTAARGHGLKLRIQQLEAEFPPVEKAFFSHPTHSSFTYNDGTYWHANIQMDQNLITQGDMPRFILDSYEECRGPPRLFMLDKFDIAGAGACLKRYSDPSFFKTELTSRGLTELATRREKKPRNVKKKTSRGKIGQTLESLLSPDAESSSALVVPSEVSGKPVKRLVRLKSRKLNRSIEIKLMDHLLGLHSDVQKVVLDSPKRHSNGMVELSSANETTSKVHDSVDEKSVSHPLLNNENITTSIGEDKRLTQTYNSEHKKIEDDLLEVPHEACEVEEADNNNLLAVQNEIIVVSTNKSGENINGYALGDAFPKVRNTITSCDEVIKLTSAYELEYQMIEDELQEISRESACKVKEVGNNMHPGMNNTMVYSSSKSGDSINDEKLNDAGTTTSLRDENTDEVIRSTSIYELEYPEIADKSIQQQEVNQVMADSKTMSGDSESDFQLGDAEKTTLLSDGYITTSMDESRRLMLTCKTENQKIENSLLEEPHREETVKSVQLAEHKELLTASETKTGNNISVYEFGDSGSLTLSEETNKALNDRELKLKSTGGDHRFKDISSDMKIFMGVVNSIESEAELNSERKNKSFISVDAMYLDSDEVPDAHKIQNSELHFVEKITGFHLNDILDDRTSCLPTSDSSCTMRETQAIQEVLITSNLDRDFEKHPGETQDNMTEELEVIEVVSSSACETCGIEICEGPDLRSDHMEASCSSIVIEPTSDSGIQNQEYHDDLQTHTAMQTDTSTSCDSLSEGTPVAKNFDGFPHLNRDLLGELHLHPVNHKDGLVSENKSGTDELFVCLSPTTNHNSASVISRTEKSLVPASGIKQILELDDKHEEACSGSSLGKEVHNDCKNSCSVGITTHEMAVASDWNGHLPDMTDQHNDFHVGCIPDSLCPLTLQPEELEEQQVEDKKGYLSELNFSVTTTTNDDLANTSANAMSSAEIEDIDKILNSQIEFSDAQSAELDHFSDPMEHQTISSEDEKGAFDHIQPHMHPQGLEVIESLVVNLNSADECIRYSSERRKQIKENAHSDENSNENDAAKDEDANCDLLSVSSTEVFCSQRLLKDNSTLHTAISHQYDEMQVHGTCSSLVSKSILDKTFQSFEQPASDHGTTDPCLQLLEEQSSEKNVSFVSGISNVQPESQSSVDDSEHSLERKQDDIERSPERSHHERSTEEISVSTNFLTQSATLPEEEDTKLQASREENLASLKKLDEHFELDTLTISSVSQPSVYDSEHSLEKMQGNIRKSPQQSHPGSASEELSVSTNFCSLSATLTEEGDTKLQAPREENLASLKKLDENFELDTLTISSVSQPSVYDSEHSLEKIQDNIQKSPQQSHPGSASEEWSASTNFCSLSATLPEEENTKLQAPREENLTSLRKLDELDTLTVPSESQSYVDNSEHSLERKQGNIQTSPEQNHLGRANEETSASTSFYSHSATLPEEKEDTKLQASRKENLASLRKLDEHFELDSLVMSSESQSCIDVSEHSLERKHSSIQRFPEQSHHGNANEDSGSTSFLSATLPEEGDTKFQASREENLTSFRKLDEHFELDTLTVDSDVITVPEEVDKLEAIRGEHLIFHTFVQHNITTSSQLDEWIEVDIDTNPTGINDNPLVEGSKANAIAFDNNNEHNDLDISWSNIDMQRQIESRIFTSSGIVSVHSARMMESNVKTMHPTQLPGFNMTNNKSSSQISYADILYQSSCSASQDIEETPPLPPLPPLQWRTVKLRDNSLSSIGNSFQNMTEKTSSFAPLPVQCDPMHASLSEDGKMVLPPHTLANVSIFEAKSYQESSLEPDEKWEMQHRLPQRPHIIHAERDESHQKFLEERYMDLLWTSSITSLQYENNSYGLDESEEPKLQPSFAPFLSEDRTSQHLPSVELEIFHDSNLSLDKHQNTSIGSDIDYEECHDSNENLCSDNDHFSSLEPSRTTALEIPHPDYAALPEENQSPYYVMLWRSEDEIPNVRPCSVRNRPRNPLIEAVAAHDRSTLRKVSDLVRPLDDHKAAERNLMLEQIRNRAFSLRPVVMAKQNIKGPSTNLKVAAIIEKANAIRQACAGSDEGEDEDSWSDS